MLAGKKRTGAKTVEIRIGCSMAEDIGRLKTRKSVEETADHTIYLKNFAQLCSILSERKLDLMAFIAEHAGTNVGSVSIRLHRQKEAVSRDLHDLQEAGLLELKKKGREVYPHATYDCLKIRIRKG